MDYGIIGNCKSCALVHSSGSIDWFCYPESDSPSVFARLLDKKNGGSFHIQPDQACTVTQQYIEDTAIVETTYTCKAYAFRVLDFFRRYNKILPKKKQKVYRINKLIRILEPIRGIPKVKIHFDPKLNYAKNITISTAVEDGLFAKEASQELYCKTNIDPKQILKKQCIEITHRSYFVFGDGDGDYTVRRALNLLTATKRYWKKWVASLDTPERYKKEIIRSAITLKLLTMSETGAIMAAATTSLPEQIGHERNWDYRFCWVRDAAYTVDALNKIGRSFEAKRLMEFIFEHSIEKKLHLQIMYGLHGETELTEEILPHLSGYKNSAPVRIGNAAYDQQQHDIYGNIIDIMYIYFVFQQVEKKLSKRYINYLSKLVREIKKHWKTKDNGIWEFRGSKEHFTYSKLMCYVGIDRAIRIADYCNLTSKSHAWCKLRDEIRHDILTNAWSDEAKAFTMYYGGEELDAAVLLMCYHEFLPPDDPRLISTVKQIKKTLANGPLVHRYNAKDDFGKSTSAFTICSFWLIDALHYIGKHKEAKKYFEQMLTYANNSGLFSEDLTMKGKHLLGNFPQAYTHIAIINTAILLSEWSTKRKKLDWAQRKKIL